MQAEDPRTTSGAARSSQRSAARASLAGLKAAIAKVLGCAWQRCTVHFLRDCLGHARREQHGLLAALIRPIFNADSLAQARDRLSEAVAHLDGRMGKVAAMLEDAEPDMLAFYAFSTYEKTTDLQDFLRWRDPDSNRGHHDFQSCALPTELSRRARTG